MACGSCLPVPVRVGKSEARWDGVALCSSFHPWPRSRGATTKSSTWRPRNLTGAANRTSKYSSLVLTISATSGPGPSSVCHSQGSDITSSTRSSIPTVCEGIYYSSHQKPCQGCLTQRGAKNARRILPDRESTTTMTLPPRCSVFVLNVQVVSPSATWTRPVHGQRCRSHSARARASAASRSTAGVGKSLTRRSNATTNLS
jgi:hypothetical protein